MNLQKINKSVNFIIFGASGDLAQLKLFPSLYELVLQKRFAKSYSIVGYARTKMTDMEFSRRVKKSIKEHVDKNLLNDKVIDQFLEHIYYHQGQYDHADDFQALSDKLLNIHSGKKVHNLAYFAVPPTVFGAIARQLGGIRGAMGGKVKIMMEKPFGDDRKSAGELFQLISGHFDKKDLHLIDHYLGKATVQSILPLRYNNTILNLLLRGEAIANIQISALETSGVDERIGYFEQVGIVKDMIQSHLLQILALITMSMPVRRDVHSIQREKGNIISALRYSDVECGVVLGQYASYKKQDGVAKDSITPTFAAFRCFIDMTDWYKMPIYIRTGKKLSHKHTYIVIEFKRPPFQDKGKEIEANRLIIEFYPYEDIQIRLVNDIGKESDQSQELITQESLACTGEGCLPAYGRLILDAFLGNNNSFLSIDEVLASWHFIDDVMKCVQKRKVPIIEYPDGNEGPEEQFELTAQDGFEWYDPDRL